MTIEGQEGLPIARGEAGEDVPKGVLRGEGWDSMLPLGVQRGGQEGSARVVV